MGEGKKKRRRGRISNEDVNKRKAAKFTAGRLSLILKHVLTWPKLVLLWISLKTNDTGM